MGGFVSKRSKHTFHSNQINEINIIDYHLIKSRTTTCNIASKQGRNQIAYLKQ